MEATRISLQYLSISRTVTIAMCAPSLGNVTRCTTPEVPNCDEEGISLEDVEKEILL
jgi:hypothetical protein